MGFFDRYILPTAIDLAMRSPTVRAERERYVPQARGEVLEIGAGSGLNMPFYDAERVNTVTALEPHPGLRKKAATAARTMPFAVQFLDLEAEKIPLDDNTMDTVLSTWTLCSIAGVTTALAEIRRVLKPGGTFIFVEHGLAPEAGVARWQNRLDTPWGWCSGGCHLNRDPGALIRAAGFDIDMLHTGYADGPKILTYMYRGAAHTT
ncbi:class I SAM-dependent methyltransferase [Varunaivibrio sulfuroxidans]|uniref:Methyltransferase family protein n=1 Tax=Varunaivibrio sulfuroxidans TaxID=1773489 RepID=A0A4R3JF76_9PROT|nr:class I SAM-dependent methyltransferase [Varunaivibrio sulfuroxidans]TCS64748.1 methyltransferase family protein [Varunaivibrio sulfuroxidans]WES29947.1 class I SAM-dependent methyltransferase [Varunaivibrio sulfuroxidans]